jgi:hypothetical protein
MAEFDPTLIPLREDGTRFFSGLSIPESIAINSTYGMGKTLPPEDAFIKLFISKLSDYQKKILLASGSKPKRWESILRHAKVKPRFVIIARSAYTRPCFKGRDMSLLYEYKSNQKGYCLTTAGKIVQDYIKKGLNRG